MPEFKNKGEYEAWKAERARAAAEKAREKIIDPVEATEPLDNAKPQAIYGIIKKKTEVAGVGCLIQFAGILVFLISFIAFPIGTAFGFLIMLSLLIIGSQKATKFYCGNCGNPVDNKGVKLCPACRIEFGK
jgi:hypothetical protein